MQLRIGQLLFFLAEVTVREEGVGSLQHAKQRCKVDKMSLKYLCLGRKWKGALWFPCWEPSSVYLTLSVMTWVNKASIKSAACAKGRGFASALEAAWESRLILTNRIWHNLDAIWMRTVWDGDMRNPLDSQKEEGLSLPFLCGKPRDASQPMPLGSDSSGKGLG